MNLKNSSRVFERTFLDELKQQLNVVILLLVALGIVSFAIVFIACKVMGVPVNLPLIGQITVGGTVIGTLLTIRRAYYKEAKKVELKGSYLTIFYFSGSTRDIKYSSIQRIVYKNDEPMYCDLVTQEGVVKTADLINGAELAQELQVPAVEYMREYGGQ